MSRVLIVVEGGVVQNVIADRDLKVFLIDHDDPEPGAQWMGLEILESDFFDEVEEEANDRRSAGWRGLVKACSVENE